MLNWSVASSKGATLRGASARFGLLGGFLLGYRRAGGVRKYDMTITRRLRSLAAWSDVII